MTFAIMMWVSSSARAGSIFGIVDKDNPGELPMPSAGGHWVDFRTVQEDRLPEAKEAREAIAKHGYYLVGASLKVTEAFGDPPSN